ncbi:hypothetical protein GCM10009605_44290 [Nocardiopsis composta]
MGTISASSAIAFRHRPGHTADPRGRWFHFNDLVLHAGKLTAQVRLTGTAEPFRKSDRFYRAIPRRRFGRAARR